MYPYRKEWNRGDISRGRMFLILDRFGDEVATTHLESMADKIVEALNKRD